MSELIRAAALLLSCLGAAVFACATFVPRSVGSCFEMALALWTAAGLLPSGEPRWEVAGSAAIVLIRQLVVLALRRSRHAE